MNKIAVITSSIGGDRKLRDQAVFKEVDYHAFVDESKMILNSTWKIHKVKEEVSNDYYSDRLIAKKYKILPFYYLKDYEYFIWIDSNIILNVDPKVLIETYLQKKDICVQKHSYRDCVYSEIKEVTSLKLDFYSKLKNQYSHYLKEGYPSDNGLYDCSIIIRKNIKSINDMSKSWWEEVNKYSSRDQISFPYVLTKHNIIPNVIESNSLQNKEYIKKYTELPTSRKLINQRHNAFSLKVHTLRNIKILIKNVLRK
jgi:hypothetical protein